MTPNWAEWMDDGVNYIASEFLQVTINGGDHMLTVYNTVNDNDKQQLYDYTDLQSGPCNSPANARVDFLQLLGAYLQDKSGTIVWKVTPELKSQRDVMTDKIIYGIHARLVVIP